ncbi:T9SS type A sorting domain-containing protein [Hymenobacter aquaticus]|nr:T9SS type A sorting domain-containing protein [Hymenobacter aquaticus]
MRKLFTPTLLACLAGAFHASAQQADLVKHHAPHALAASARSTDAYVQTRALEQIYRAAAWKDTLRTTNSRFTAAQLPAVVLREQSGNGGSSWTATRRNHRRFTAANAVLTDTTFSFNTAGTATPRFAKANSYTSSGKLAQSTLRWQLGVNWQNYGRDTYTYSAQDLLSQLLLEGFSGGSYYNSSRSLFTYNAQSLPVVEEVQQFDDATQGWQPLEKYLSTYNAAGAIEQEVTQQVPLNGTTYQNYRRETYFYSTQQPVRVVRTLVESWNGNAWINAGQNLFAYDANGSLSSITTQLYKPASSAYVDYYRYQYSYQVVNGTASAHALAAGLTLLPNPASAGQAQATFRLPRAEAATIDVLDLAGRVVRSLSPTATPFAEQRVALPTQGLAPGLYVVRLTAGGLSQQQQLLLR